MPPISTSTRRARHVLGTIVEITVRDASAASAEAAIEAAFGAIETVHKLMSYHDADSDVGRLNRQRAGTLVSVAPWTRDVLATASQLFSETDGAFDIGVAASLERLDYLPADGPATTRDWTRSSTPGPSVTLHPDGRVSLSGRDRRIDLGGIAKGFAVDRAIDVLRAHGVEQACVNAGGDLACFGPEPEPVHLREPVTGRVWRAALLSNAALATSGPRRVADRSEAIGDTAIIDPAAGRQAAAIVGASVVAASCLIADALTKVVMLRGTDALPVLQCHAAAALLIEYGGRVVATQDWPRAEDAPQ